MTDTAGVQTTYRRFAERECKGYSELYYRLSLAVAADDDVAGFIAEMPVVQPNLFLAAIQLLTGPERMPDASGLKTFLDRRGGEVRDVMRARRTQTNEVGRCSFLLPAFTHVYRLSTGRPLALIDVGCSAGLHLRWDRYHYDYGVTQVGDPRSAVTLKCELRGNMMPPLPAVVPPCGFRLGIDLHPVDLTNPTERRWFEALIWPEHERRLRLARAAIDEVLRDPPAIVNGDAVNVLAPRLDTVPSDTSLIVYNSAALCQGGPVDEQAIANVLLAHASRRPVYWLHCENEEVRLRALNDGRMVETKLANKDGHGRWLEWLRS